MMANLLVTRCSSSLTFSSLLRQGNGGCGIRQNALLLVLGGGKRSLSTSSLLCSSTTIRGIGNNTHFNSNNYSKNNNKAAVSSSFTIHRRSLSYEPLTPSEEEAEKERVAKLTPYAKEQELRHYNREIARLELLRGINNGERYTWSGRYKLLARNYGMPLMAWYWTCFGSTFIGCWTAISLGGLDAMQIISQVDAYFQWNLQSQIDPTYGKIGLALVMNELLEPLRLPFVIVTVKPVVDRLFPSQF